MKPQEFLRENEFIGDDAHEMHKSHQLHMLREECYHSAANAIKLHKLLGELPEGHDLDAWAAEKISLANDYLKTVTEWLEYDVMGGTNEAMMSGGMEAFSMESAERQYAELLGEDQGVVEGFTDTLKSVWRGLKAQVVDFAANAVGLPDDQRREVFVQAGNEFSNEVITLLANHPARDKLIPMIREIGGYMAKARTLKEFNSVMDKAGLFLADVEAIKFNPPSGVAKALPSYRDKQGVAEGLEQAQLTPEVIQVVQDLRKAMKIRSELSAKKTMLVIKFPYQLGSRYKKIIKDTLTQAGITFKIKENKVSSVRGGEWINTLVGIPYNQQGVAEGKANNDLRDNVLAVLTNIYNGSVAGEYMIDDIADELNDYFDQVQQSNDPILQKAYSFMVDNGQEAEDNPKLMARIAQKAISLLSQQGVAEGVQDESYQELQDRYNELAPSIEKYKDKAGAERLYNELSAIAKQHGLVSQFRNMCNVARNSAHQDYDTNPGGFENWFWYLPFARDLAEERTEVKDKDGNIIRWSEEDKWEKSTNKKNPRGQVTNLSDRARRETEKLNKEGTGVGNKLAQQNRAELNQWRMGMSMAGEKEPTVAENTLDQDLDKIAENFSSSISTVFKPGSGPKTGSLFGGTYKNPSSPFRKKSVKKESIIKR